MNIMHADGTVRTVKNEILRLFRPPDFGSNLRVDLEKVEDPVPPHQRLRPRTLLPSVPRISPRCVLVLVHSARL